MKPIREFCKKGTTQETVFDMKEVPANEADDYLFKEDMFTPLKKGRGRLKQLFQRKLGACTHMASNDLDAGLNFDADVAHNKIPKQETEEEVTRSSWTFGESARLLSLRTISQCSFCL
jgi:hypothetical protein